MGPWPGLATGSPGWSPAGLWSHSGHKDRGHLSRRNSGSASHPGSPHSKRHPGAMTTRRTVLARLLAPRAPGEAGGGSQMPRAAPS